MEAIDCLCIAARAAYRKRPLPTRRYIAAAIPTIPMGEHYPTMLTPTAVMIMHCATRRAWDSGILSQAPSTENSVGVLRSSITPQPRCPIPTVVSPAQLTLPRCVAVEIGCPSTARMTHCHKLLPPRFLPLLETGSIRHATSTQGLRDHCRWHRQEGQSRLAPKIAPVTPFLESSTAMSAIVGTFLKMTPSRQTRIATCFALQIAPSTAVQATECKSMSCRSKRRVPPHHKLHQPW